MPKAAGCVLDFTMLRPSDWLDIRNFIVGGSVALEIPELGAQSNARVLGVYPCQEIKPGPGHVITATCAHPATFQVLDVTSGEDRKQGSTHKWHCHDISSGVVVRRHFPKQ
jgi:hypothetical protein